LIAYSVAVAGQAFAQKSAPLNAPAPPNQSPGPTAPPNSTDNRTRLELNLLGKENTAAGEGRRNENVQFNLVDNNVIKELNIRLGATATIIEQFNPELSFYSAEFGNPPSAVLRLSRAARAGWHGNVFFNHQNSVFSARSFFQFGDVKPAHDNRYGFTTGLRPWRNGYLSIQGRQDRLRGFVNGNVLVPTAEERRPRTADPAKRAVIERFLAAYPAEPPNRTDVNPRALNTNAPQKIDGDESTIRVEQQVSSRDRVLTMYRFIDQNVNAFQLLAGQNPNTRTKSHRGRITWSRVWAPTVTTNFAVSYDRVGSLLIPEPNAVGPTVSIAGLTTLGPLAIIPIDRAQNVFGYEGQWKRAGARHEWTAGFDILRRQFNGTETDAHRGFLSFTNDFGRTGIENFLLGEPSTYIIAIGNVHRGFRQTLPKLYVGDNWRAAANLTLQLGLRYEIAARPVEAHDLNRVPYGCDCNNLAPQAGVAYRLPSEWGLLRAGYGLQYGDILPVTFSQIRFSPPGSVKLTIPAPNLLDPLGGLKQGGGSADARGNIYELDPGLRSPYSHQYNFSWEPAFTRNWRVQLGYVGSRTHKLLIMWYLNRAHATPGIPQTTETINQRRANPDLAEIRHVLNGSRAYFDAARARLVGPRIHGLSFEAAYWFSKAMDLGADYANTAYDADSRLSRSQSEFETHKDRKAPSLFDQPHSFLARASYELPSHPVQGWAGTLLSGWSAAAVMLLKKGTPFTVTTPDGPGFGNVDGNGGDRPNLIDPAVLGRTVGNPDTSRSLLPASAFAFMAPTAESGNLGANTFRRGGIRNVNASLSKIWRISSEQRVTLRAECINLTNTPQFAEPGNVLGTPEFGSITNTLNDGRAFRFGLAVDW
jgi:hypothetical protein